MSDIRHSIDWLQYSLGWPDSVNVWPLDQAEESAVFKTCVPMLEVSGLPPHRPAADKSLGMKGYKKTWDMLWCTCHVTPERRDQKIGVRFTGKDCVTYRELGGTDQRLIEFCKYNNASVTRIDIAFDLFDFRIDPMQIYRDWISGKVKTRARTLTPLSKSVRAANGEVSTASTLYIGSRSSPVMVRIYEKGKQMGVELDWCRIELEIKDDKANSVLDDCVRLGLDNVARALLIEAMPTMPYKFWKPLTAGKSIALGDVGRKKTSRQVWLENVVLPLISEELNNEWQSEEPMVLSQAVEALLRSNWQRRALEIRRSFGLT